ncbi:MAG: hypothetical protein QM813_05070 [Verrucomicrobiota bacterium]
MTPLLETIAAALERPREITTQVGKHLDDTHGIAREAIGAFLETELPKLEDYEVDLILSPLFTPTLHDQVAVAELLGDEPVAAAQWPELVRQLVARPTRAPLRTEDGVGHQIPLREVVVERFVHRLRLDGTIVADVFRLIGSLPQASDRALLKAIARRLVWENPGRREILVRYLNAVGDSFHADDAVALLKLVETYEPAGTADLLAQIPHWQQVLRQELNDSGTKPFFNERVEELHGGGRDQRRQNQGRMAAKEAEQAFLQRLQRVLAT